MRKELDRVKIQIILSEIQFKYEMRYPVRTSYTKKCQRYKTAHAIEDLTAIMTERGFTTEDIKHVVSELMITQRKRYGEKMKGGLGGYECVRSSFELKDLVDWLEFELNSFHLPHTVTGL